MGTKNQVLQVIQMIQVMQASPVGPLSPVSPVSPVSLAHLWVLFGVIFIEILSGKFLISHASRTMESTESENDKQKKRK